MSAVVTGAGRGIGAAVARLLARRGDPVALLDVDGAAARAAELADEFSATTVGLDCDVTDAAAVERALTAAEEALGPVTALANVAGILRTAPVVGTTDEDWAASMAVNAGGVLHTCRAVARRWTAGPPEPPATRPDRAIVTVASNAAGTPRVGMVAYAASKAAASAATRCVGLELAAYGVRANVVAPGSTDTPMLAAMGDVPADPAALVAGSPEHYKLGIPLGRIADPDDVAATVAFLLSDAARHITLQTLTVDGGATLGL